MSKKNKIIISLISVGIVLIGIAVSLILIFWKRFDIRPTNEIVYSNCTQLTEMHYSTDLSNQSILYDDATAIVQNNGTLKYGVFNYLQNKTIIPLQYDSTNITKIDTIDQDSSSIYTLYALKNLNEISIFSSKGNTKLTTYNASINTTTAQIKEKNINVKIKKNNSYAKSRNSFTTKEIDIFDIEYVTSYYKSNEYNYEIWDITAQTFETFRNLYRVNNDGTRTLIQTLNKYVGVSPELTNDSYDIVFLKNGDIRLFTNIAVSQINDNTTHQLSIYDINFNKKGDSQITIDSNNTPTTFRVGNFIIYQYKIPASSNKYDFCEYNGITTTYYKLVTKKFNLKNGALTTANFKYLIEDVNDSFNDESVELHMRKIKNKSLENMSSYIANDKLQVKEIKYNILGEVYKITKSRYLVKSGTNEYTLIEKNYNKVCTISNVESFFTTTESIIYVNKIDHKTYICSLDGIIVKVYDSGVVSNLHNSKYYGVTFNETIGGEMYEQMYLERLGKLGKQIYSKNVTTGTYKNNNQNYNAIYTSITNSGVGLIVKAKQVDLKFSYTITNLEGKELMTISGVENLYNQTEFANHCTVNYCDNKNVLLYFSTGLVGHFYLLNN